MKNDTYLTRALHHYETVHLHRKLVRQHCFACGLYTQGLKHDLSKYYPLEFLTSAKYYRDGTRSPYVYEKEIYGYSMAWLHHKGINKHHWEYWYDVIDGKWQPLKMPFKYVVEMACDRIAACKVYQKENYTDASAIDYLNSKHDQYFMHPETLKQLREILECGRDEGEEKTFAKIKQIFKEKPELLK